MRLPSQFDVLPPRGRAKRRDVPLGRLTALIASSAALTVFAQTATICGSLGNFDAVSNTGLDGCGFELDLNGVLANTPVGSTRAGRLMQPSQPINARGRHLVNFSKIE